MKKLLIISTLITIFMSQVQAQNTDLQLIEENLNFYFKGFTNQDSESLKKAFHPTATMKWIDEKNDYVEVNAIDALVGFIESSPKQKMNTRIIAINIAGNAASAQLELEFETFSYIDFMHLLKIDGKWKIVSKIYSQRMKRFEQ